MARDVKLTILTKEPKDRILKYLQLFYHIHKLTDKEMELTTEIVFIYSKYLKQYGEMLANKLIFDSDTRKEIRKNMNNMADPVFQNYLSNLRRKRVIIDNKLVKGFIPPMEDFNLNVLFREKT